MNFAPNNVSWRVVKIFNSLSPAGVVFGSSAKRISMPSERPIQLRCISRTLSGQRSSVSSASSSSCEYFVILKTHWLISRCSTIAPERQPRPSITCSLASTVMSTGSQFSLRFSRSARPARRKSRNIFC